MLIAVDQYNNRIPASKGAGGHCQLCGNEVRAYCGDIYIHHWRHVSACLCDSWKENESDWHRDWKNRFPQEWREVIVTDASEKHIADIRTPGGLVLELQNSSISSSTIRIREEFYGSIFWLINAENFRDNFSIRSCVTTKLRYIEEGYRSIHLPQQDSIKLEKMVGDGLRLEKAIENLSLDNSNILEKIEKIQKYRQDISAEAARLLGMGYYYTYGILEGFRPSQKDDYDAIAPSLKEKHALLASREGLIKRICSLPLCKLQQYAHYRMIQFQDVSPSSYANCMMIESTSEESLFPEVVTFRSELEFSQIAKNKQYLLYVDPKRKLDALQLEIEKFQDEIQGYEQQRIRILDATSEELISFLEIREIELKSAAQQNELGIADYRDALHRQGLAIEATRAEESIQHERELRQYEQDRLRERTAAMKKYKGLYSYHWKHRRKSWDFSERKLFLDFENHIFEKIDEDLFKKISYQEFIRMVMQWPQVP